MGFLTQFFVLPCPFCYPALPYPTQLTEQGTKVLEDALHPTQPLFIPRNTTPDLFYLATASRTEAYRYGSAGFGSFHGKQLGSVALAHAITSIGHQILHLICLHAHLLQKLARKDDLHCKGRVYMLLRCKGRVYMLLHCKAPVHMLLQCKGHVYMLLHCKAPAHMLLPIVLTRGSLVDAMQGSQQ